MTIPNKTHKTHKIHKTNKTHKIHKTNNKNKKPNGYKSLRKTWTNNPIRKTTIFKKTSMNITRDLKPPGWPYYKLFITKNILESRIKEIKNLKFVISNQPRKPKAIHIKTRAIPYTFNGKYVSFVNNDYLKYDILPLVYSEPQLLKCQIRRKPIPIEKFNNMEQHLWDEFRAHSNYKRIINNTKIVNKYSPRYRLYTPELLEAYREFLYSKIDICNNYRPTMALQTYIFLGDSKSVFDFSAGWGDRLFAACISGIKYIGLDPNINNRSIYKNIIENHGSNNNQKVITTGAEYLPINVLKRNMMALGISSFDIITTSPPYYNFETYSTSAQSAMGFIDSPRWLIFWLGNVIHRYIPFLRPGGYFALYLQDTDKFPFVEPLTLCILSNPNLFENLKCCGIINSTQFPIIVFQKPDYSNQNSRDKNITEETNNKKLTQINKPREIYDVAESYRKLLKKTYPEHYKFMILWLKTRKYLYDINTDSLTRTVVKYLINKTGELGHIPLKPKYINLAKIFNVKIAPDTTPQNLDGLFIELWIESIHEYKLIYKNAPETNIHPIEYLGIYSQLFKSII